MTQELKQLIAEMNNDGWNPEDIADELGLDVMEVINYCCELLCMEAMCVDNRFFDDPKKYMKGE